jgi:hypothetical protein
VVQDVQFICDRDTGGLQVSDGPDNVAILHVATWVIVQANNQKARMFPAGSLNQQVQVFKVVMVPGKQDQFLLDGVHEMAGIRNTGKTGIARDGDLVASSP